MTNWLERQRWLPVVILLGCAGLVLCFRLHGLDLALDSDEGDYAHVAQRLLAGDKLYVDVFDNKPPTVHFTYALALWLFGDSDHSIRWLGIIASLATLAAVYGSARQLFGAGMALWIAFLFCFLNVEPRSHSHICKVELFLAPFMFTALALSLRFLAGRQWRWLIAAGFCVGVATSYKPWFLLHVPMLMMLAWRGDTTDSSEWPSRLKRWGAIVGAAALPGLFWLGWLLMRADWSAAWDAIVVFNSHIAKVESSHANPLWNWVNQWIELCKGESWGGYLLPLWYVGVFFAIVLVLRPEEPRWRLLGAWTVLMLMEVTAGPRLSTYYFGPILPLVAMTALWGFRLVATGRRAIWVALNAGLSLLVFVQVWTSYLGQDDHGIMMKMWDHDVYKNFRALGFQLRRILPADERLYMWGFDTVNFYSQRRSGSRYHYVTPGEFEPWRLRQLVDDVIRNRPMMFYENHAYPAMPAELKQFLNEHYEPVFQAGLFTLNVLKEKRGLWSKGVKTFQASQAVGPNN